MVRLRKHPHIPPIGIIVLVILFTLILRIIPGLIAATSETLLITESAEYTATEDTFIAESNPTRTNQSSAVLWLNNTPGQQRRALVKFNVTGIPSDATITQAVFKIHASNGDRSNGSADSSGFIAQVNGVWTESTVTWSTAPQVGTTIADLLPSGSTVPGEIKTTSVLILSGNDEVNLYLINNSPTNDDIFYTSSNGTTQLSGTGFIKPTLRVEWTRPAGSDPTPSPVSSPPAISLTHGPIVGGVTHNEAKIFGRTGTPAVLQAEYSTDASFASGVAVSSSVTTDTSADYTGMVTLSNLVPDTLYYYRFVGNATVYQFQTFPDPLQLASFTFAVFADLASSDVAAPVYQQAALDNPRFVMQIGDFPHMNPAKSPTPITISNWWLAAKRAIRDYNTAGVDLANHLLSKYPFVHIWDDHDYGDDNYDYRNPHKYDKALPAFKSYYPTYPLVNGAEGLWHSFKYGSNVEFFILDLRSQRSPNGATDGPNKSMLDHQKLSNSQKNWLLNGLKNSSATWKIVVSTSVWNKKAKVKNDSWNLFKNEQQQIVDYLKTHGIKNVIVMSADLHSGGAIDVGTGLSGLTGGCTDPVNQSWCIPELSVPHTNMVKYGCTGNKIPDTCGIWDQGVVDPVNDPMGGYGLITVNGNTSVRLEAKKSDGTERLQYLIQAK